MLEKRLNAYSAVFFRAPGSLIHRPLLRYSGFTSPDCGEPMTGAAALASPTLGSGAMVAPITGSAGGGGTLPNAACEGRGDALGVLGSASGSPPA